MPRCEETYPDDPTAQCRKAADPPGTLVSHEHEAIDSEGWHCTWRSQPPPGQGVDR